MFTVPKEYRKDRHREFMLKELSYLFCKIYMQYSTSNLLNIKLKDMSIEITQKNYQGRWKRFSIFIEPYQILFEGNCSSDSLIFKDCQALKNTVMMSDLEIEEFVEKTNIMKIIKEKIESANENFIRQ